MKQEHSHHVIVISIMLFIILATFSYVLVNNRGARITTSLPAVYSGNMPMYSQQNNRQTEVDILIGLLIMIALLVVWWLGIRISHEIKHGALKEKPLQN